MPVVKVGVGPIQTPCGPVSFYQTVKIPGFSFDFSFILNFPPKFYIPWPDCAFFKHLNSAPEPASDSGP